MAKKRKSISITRCIASGNIVDLQNDKPKIAIMMACDPSCPYIESFDKNFHPTACTADFSCPCLKQGKPSLHVANFNESYDL